MIKQTRRILAPVYNADLAALGLLLLLTCIFFWRSLMYGKIPAPTDTLVGLYHPYRDAQAEEYPNGIPFKNFLITDPVRQQIPWRKSVITSYIHHELPLWDATSFSGTPLLANIQSGAFYPLNLLFFIFPFTLAWTCLIISQILLAGWFFYLFLRTLRLNPAASLFGAIIFSYSGSSMMWLTWGTIVSAWLWTPLALTAVYNLINGYSSGRLFWSSVLFFSTACSFFAGHLQIFIYSILLTGAYAFWLVKADKKVLHAGTFIPAGLLIISAISYQLLAVLRWLPFTGRISAGGSWENDGFFIPLRHLVQFVAPDYFGNPATLNYWGTWNYGELTGYVGMAGLLFALAGIYRKTSFWIVTGSVALLSALQWPVSTIPFVLHIPVFSGLQPTRLLFVVNLCLSVMAAYGFSRIFTDKEKRYLFMSVAGPGVLLLVLWASYFMHGTFGISAIDALVIKRNLYLPSLLYLVLGGILILVRVVKNKHFRPLAMVAVLFLIVSDLFRFGWKFTPFTDRTLFFPTTKILSFLSRVPKPFRIMTTDDRILPPDTNTYYGIESVSGYDPLFSTRYEQYAAAMERGAPDIRRPYGFDRIIVPKNFKSPLADLLNIRYVLSFSEISDTRFRKIMSEGNTILYENTSVLPRAYLAGRIIYRKTDQEIMDAMYGKEFNYHTDAVVERPVDILNVDVSEGETVRITGYFNNSLHIRAISEFPRLLVVGNVYNPGWTALVDGRKTPIIRTNYIFMGILIPAGNHTVTMEYK